jgi:hypothetical protein
MEKIATKDVTEAIARAMENVDKMKRVVIIYETTDDITTSTGGVIVNDEATLSQINWLLDMGKQWLFSEMQTKPAKD